MSQRQVYRISRTSRPPSLFLIDVHFAALTAARTKHHLFPNLNNHFIPVMQIQSLTASLSLAFSSLALPSPATLTPTSATSTINPEKYISCDSSENFVSVFNVVLFGTYQQQVAACCPAGTKLNTNLSTQGKLQCFDPKSKDVINSKDTGKGNICISPAKYCEKDRSGCCVGEKTKVNLAGLLPN